MSYSLRYIRTVPGKQRDGFRLGNIIIITIIIVILIVTIITIIIIIIVIIIILTAITTYRKNTNTYTNFYSIHSLILNI